MSVTDTLRAYAAYAAVPAAIWSFFLPVVQLIGIYKIFRYYSSPPPKAVSPTLDKDKIPHITIIRPVKDLEPRLYECLASTFRQDYPRDKLTLRFCVDDEGDPAYPLLERLLGDFPGFDARILVEEYDPVLNDPEHPTKLGPNPKIRNVSRAYREAKGDDLIWIIDCNVWIGRGVAGRMVDKLEGYAPGGKRVKPYKFVHQLPLVVDISGVEEHGSQAEGAGAPRSERWTWRDVWARGGGRLEEMFMATTHAKFYSAINTVGVAPCIVGKSNMFRKAHLDRYTDPGENPHLRPQDAERGRGIDFFSSYICEDHLIGDLLWRAPIPGHRNHGLVFGDLAVQPMAGMPVGAYWGRRVRWLRVRKWTVMAATLVEPCVESLVYNLLCSFALTTIPGLFPGLHIPPVPLSGPSCWLLGVSIWMVVDRIVYRKLHACQSVEVDENTPAFAMGTSHPGGAHLRPLSEWLPAWFGREILALPIWTWAVLLGTTVTWRKKHFRVMPNMSVVAIDKVSKAQASRMSPELPPSSNGYDSKSQNGGLGVQRPKARTVASGRESVSARRRHQYSGNGAATE
ncbi:Ceramide glucosyltransferase-A [Pleurostoma richardsiae]|uniref:Ceramide glucosyltransferase n=1 Tax=Pleurostoma richardsiae TaxID=41990 RepID=A0AA38VLV5_9PEZI|nr:Ceramide glucosyltransferase-A [Pleurostoma richardsiae]